MSTKWIERFEKLRLAFDPEGSFKNYRKLSTEPPCIPFVGVTLKDLTFVYDGNPDKIQNSGINFRKMRLIAGLIYSLNISSPEHTDYSFLEFNINVAQSILTMTPLTQDELYNRSVQISDSMNATSDTCEDVPLLRKEIRYLRDEVTQLKEIIQKNQIDMEKKDKKIAALKARHGKAKFRKKASSGSTSNIFDNSRDESSLSLTDDITDEIYDDETEITEITENGTLEFPPRIDLLKELKEKHLERQSD